MQRRTLDILFSIGGVLLAVLLAVLGLVLRSNANFANDYVHDQLAAQSIQFKAADTLTEEEAAKPCLVKYAGQEMTTGKQAECYANDFIGLHLEQTAVADDGTPYTYATIGGLQRELRAQVEEATTNNDPALEDLQAQLDTVNGQRDTLFRGETLRGLLLTSFGFSEFGRKADQAATVSLLAALVLLLASIAGFVHAFRTSKAQAFAPVSPTSERALETV
jgi:hypothetical protein